MMRRIVLTLAGLALVLSMAAQEKESEKKGDRGVMLNADDANSFSGFSDMISTTSSSE